MKKQALRTISSLAIATLAFFAVISTTQADITISDAKMVLVDLGKPIIPKITEGTMLYEVPTTVGSSEAKVTNANGKAIGIRIIQSPLKRRETQRVQLIPNPKTSITFALETDVPENKASLTFSFTGDGRAKMMVERWKKETPSLAKSKSETFPGYNHKSEGGIFHFDNNGERFTITMYDDLDHIKMFSLKRGGKPTS